MAPFRCVALSAILALSACATAGDQKKPSPPVQLAQPAGRVHAPPAPVWRDLETFTSDADFLAYVRAARDDARSRGLYWAQTSVQYAQAEPVKCPPPYVNCPQEVPPPTLESPPVPPPPPPPPAMIVAPHADSVVVTGSRLAAPQSAPAPVTSVTSNLITNNQTVGVDEGDIVKQIGHFLLVLQDGRLFSVDIRPRGRAGLRFVDRVNVYRGHDEDTWYDEMLVYGQRIVVTGYSYDKDATEFTVLNMSAAGRLTREATYYISSNDYYDIENYASRIIGDKLVIYSPLALRQINPDEPLEWPLVRRWTSTGEDHMSKGSPLFDARNIYRPVQGGDDQTIHTISVCPLASTRAGDELNCHATGFVAPGDHQFYVSPTDAYLWATDTSHDSNADCQHPDAYTHGAPSTLYRLPISGAAPGALHVRGAPNDQFSLHTSETEFHALLIWNDVSCPTDAGKAALKFFTVRLADFDTHGGVTSEGERHFTDVPSPGVDTFANRFTDRYVVYGGRRGWFSYPPFQAGDVADAAIIAVPIDNPAHATIMQAPHNVIRVERVGDNAVLTGYHSDAGLSVSLVDLMHAPRIASTALLEHRYESEGRSHAFNSAVDENGAGFMGVPTVERRIHAGRWWWRSEASDVSFLSVNRAGRLSSIGPLTADPHAQRRTYHCEVSCVDWYGNTRPIFTDGRVFALSGVEIVEGFIRSGAIRERRRVNLSGPPPH